MYDQRVGAGVAWKVTTVILSQGQFLQWMKPRVVYSCEELQADDITQNLACL